MTVCKHCGGRIVPVNWANGPGWMHDGGWSANSYWCPPVSFAEPKEEPRVS